MMSIDDNEKLKAEYEEWRDARASFNARIEAKDPEAIREAWQKFYMKGKRPSGKEAEVTHTNRRRLNKPK